MRKTFAAALLAILAPLSLAHAAPASKSPQAMSGKKMSGKTKPGKTTMSHRHLMRRDPKTGRFIALSHKRTSTTRKSTKMTRHS